jgi:hypothetical protein
MLVVGDERINGRLRRLLSASVDTNLSDLSWADVPEICTVLYVRGRFESD